jgi:hypothetical protein
MWRHAEGGKDPNSGLKLPLPGDTQNPKKINFSNVQSTCNIQPFEDHAYDVFHTRPVIRGQRRRK